MSTFVQGRTFETWTGRVVRKLRRRRNETCIHVLAYHSISARPSVFTGGTGLRHEPAEFERHLDYLLAHYEPMRLSDVVARLERGEPVHRSVVITFDDGFADAMHTAGAITVRRRVPVTIFPVTGVVGNQDLIWQHKLAWLCANGHGDRAGQALSAAGVGSRGAEETVESFARRCFHAGVPELLEEVVRRVGSSGREIASSLRPYLEPEDIARAEPDLFEFGNHTHRHVILAALDEAGQRAELETARDLLRAWTGAAPIALAYPFGLKRHYTQRTAQLAVETGHRAMLDARRRVNVTGRTRATELSRKPAPVGSQIDFEMLVEDWPANSAALEQR